MARGIISHGDILTHTTDGVPLNSIWQEFQATIATVNRDRNLLASLFTFDINQPSDVLSLDGDKMNFESKSEFGAPKSGQVSPTSLVVGFPLDWFDLRIAYTEDFLRDATAAQIETQHNAALEANNRLLFNSTLRALLTKTEVGSRPTNDEGTQIYALYDGSADSKPPSFAGQTFASGHDHYLVSGAATVDGQDLSDLIKTIQHHGHGINGTEKIVILVNPQEGEAVRGFRAGIGSSPYDFIPSEGAPAFLTSENIIGDKPPATFQGLPVIGSYASALVVESYYIPAGYVTAVATSGANSSRNPLGFRQHATRTEWRGLRMKPGTERYPLVGSTYAQGFGLGVRNRGAGAVIQIKESGTYDSPSIP